MVAVASDAVRSARAQNVSGASAAARRASRTVVALRIGHGVVVAFFIGCMAILYASSWDARVDRTTWVAVAALSGEGGLVLASRGDCPLAPVFRRLGDETPFFELLLPAKVAKQAVPFLGAVTALGFVLLAVRTA